MSTFTGSMKINFAGTQAASPDKGSAAHSVAQAVNQAFANGTAANQANQMFVDTRTVSGSSNDDLDLSGSFVDELGATIAFTSIKGFLITSDAANGDVLNIGAGTNPFFSFFADSTDILKVHPGGTAMLVNPTAAGYAVTASTADILRIANADASSATYTIYLIGTI
jgi:hypothetical protein